MYTIGVDLGGTNLRVGIVDKEGNIIDKDRVKTIKTDYKKNLSNIVEKTFELLGKQGLKLSDISSVGIGIPGFVDKKEGVSIFCPNISLTNISIRDELIGYMKVPVYIENDANCAALSESILGAAKGSKSSVTITVGTGIGSGVIIDDKIYTGYNGAAVEAGHMVIVSGGRKCKCGRRGCWEAYASSSALTKKAREEALRNPSSILNDISGGVVDKINAKTVFDACKLGDKKSSDMVNKFMRYLAEGLTNIINLFQCEVIVIGGGISNEGDYLINPLKDIVNECFMYNCYTNPAQIKAAQIANDAGLVGAALLERVF